MSKVKCFMDTKQKAIHRQRRYETLHKKLSRAQKAERDEYHYWDTMLFVSVNVHYHL